MAINPSDMSIAQLLASEAEDLVNPLPIEFYTPEFARRRAAMLASERAPLSRASRQRLPVSQTGLRGADVRRFGELQGRLASGAAEAAQRADIAQRREMGEAALKRFRDASRAEEATKLAQAKAKQAIARELGTAFGIGTEAATGLAEAAKKHQEGLRARGRELGSQMGRQMSYLDTLSDVSLGSPVDLGAGIGVPAPELDVSNRHWLDYDFSSDRPIYAGAPLSRQFSYGDTLKSDIS
tara:strand:- start:66 stop:782 length:717 start_codon:yes stop_codon:yes gene_type:complete